jgi:long-chain fatty acid transport protein
VNYKLNDGWTLKGGLALDQSPVKGATTRSVRLPDNDRTWVSLGAAMKIMQNGRLDMGYSHLFIKDADINFTRSQQAPGFTTPTPAPGTASTVAGSYTGSVDIFSIQYTISF